jgi:hypothetical protein
MADNLYRGYCLRHCAHADALVQGVLHDKPGRVLAEAMLSGAVFHVHRAYVTHMREISENYNCPDAASVETAQQLSDLLGEQQLASPEADEIVLLIEDRASWLVRVISAYREILEPTSSPQIPIASVGITLVQDNSTSPQYSGQDVALWLSAMIEMFERHRELMREY